MSEISVQARGASGQEELIPSRALALSTVRPRYRAIADRTSPILSCGSRVLIPPYCDVFRFPAGLAFRAFDILIVPNLTGKKRIEMVGPLNRSASFAQRLTGGARVIGCNRACAVATLGPNVLLLWRTAVVADGVNWLRRAFLEVRPGLSSPKVGMLCVAEQDCDVVTPGPVRSELVQVFRKNEARLAAVALAFEGIGLRASLARSVVTAINLASRTRFPNMVFNNYEEAASWLVAKSHDTAVAPREFMRAINEMRQL